MSLAVPKGMAAVGLLVVEDDALVSWALQRAAASLKIPVHVAMTGAEALEAVRNHPCHLAFVDVRLPDADGIELTAVMRSAYPDMRVVVITSDATPANRERAFRSGAWHFMEKPFEMAEVAKVIAECATTYPGRRAHERRTCTLPLRIEMVGNTDGAIRPSFEGTALEASQGGLRVRTAYPLQPGQRLRVRAAAGARPNSVEILQDAVVRVVWAQPGSDGVTAGLAYVASMGI